MKRIVVLGGTGFFGGAIAAKLREAGLEPLIGSRTAGDMMLDADDPAQLRAHLRQRDLVIDAAGPFQRRTPALIEAAASIGFDVIDLSDSPDYTSMIHQHEPPIAAAGIRVLTACSTLSTVSAAVLAGSRIRHARRLTVYLRPAARQTANRGSVTSFLDSLTGRSRTIRFRQPVGVRRGVTVKSVDNVTLPRLFSSLREAELVVDTGIPGANEIVRATTRYRQVHALVSRFRSTAIALARRIGPATGVLAYEVATAGEHEHHFFSGETTHLIAVLPAVLAAQSIAAGRFSHRGVVPPTQHADPAELFEAIRREGISIQRAG